MNILSLIKNAAFVFLFLLPVSLLAQQEGKKEEIQSLNQQVYQIYREDVVKAKSLAHKALSLSVKSDLPKEEADSYINLSRCFRLEGNWDSAEVVLHRALKISDAIDYHEGLQNANNNLGGVFLRQGKSPQAKTYFQRSLVHARNGKNLKGQANAFNNLAIIAQLEAEYDSALHLLEKSLLVEKERNDAVGVSRNLANQARIFDFLEKNEKALRLCYQALAIQDSLSLNYQKANTLSFIADLYIKANQYPNARKALTESIKLRTEIGDVDGLVTAYYSLGSILDSETKAEEAISYLRKGLKYAYEVEDDQMIGLCLISIGELYHQLPEKSDSARVFLRKADQYLTDVDLEKQTVYYNVLGAIAIREEKFSQAIPFLEKELSIALETGDLNSQKHALNNLSIVYKERKQPRLALQYTDQYHAIKDSLVNLQSLETINQLNIEYETEKKEKDNLRLQNELQQSELDAAAEREGRNQILWLGSIILLIGTGGFIWYRYRQRLRLKEQAFELEQERARQEQRHKEAEKLRELDAMKTRFFTNISHEFRTPLTLILGQNEQLQAAVANPALRDRFRMVDRNGHRLLDLINQVLDVAKLEAGGMTLEAEAMDAIPFCKNLFYAFEAVAAEKQIHLQFESNVASILTAFDLKKLERVIFNLLSNAVKFTPEGGQVRMNVQQKGSGWQIVVSDTGIGMRKEELPHVFDRFYQADSSESQPQPGTGIGLSLAKELVELHQGNIRVESEVGQGSRFIIELPIPEDLAGYDKAAISEDEKLRPAAVPLRDMGISAIAESGDEKTRILVVEDNADIRSYVRDQLQGFGYQVLEAENGEVGLAMAKEHLPDLVISDVMMPKVDGYGVAKGMRKDERTSHIPLIMLTSKASDESRIKGFEHGIDEYLLKPFNAKELKARIVNLLEQRKRLRQRFSSATTIRPNEVSAVPIDQAFVQKVLQTIEDNLSEPQFGVEQLSEAAGMSVTHLNRKLRALVDQSAGKLIRSMRLQRAADLLKQQAATVSEIAYDLGFSDPTHFTRSFKKQFGMSPTEYVRGQ
ncbi:MAG: tetratricopeptide repeat protein [Bacteroidota bacterium]